MQADLYMERVRMLNCHEVCYLATPVGFSYPAFFLFLFFGVEIRFGHLAELLEE